MKRLICLLPLFWLSMPLWAIGEAGTYFEVYVPPNNDPVRRDVALIVTALYDSTAFSIIDDDMDGDDDDSVSGMLMAGQSYVLYMREGAVNDDANHPGQSGAKQDGDYFIITSSKLVFVSQSCDSDWQHDWVPATNKTSRGTRFIVYSPRTSYSNRDLNVFAYEADTEVTIRKVSTQNHTGSGYTAVNLQQQQVVAQRTIQPGEDLIFYHREGRDIMETGATYLIEANKAVTVQYGALWGNARDGGGSVPSANGSSSGDLFYFSVPYQGAREQEIRIVSWDAANTVTLAYYQRGDWVPLADWELDALAPGDWVSYTGNLNAVFRVSCTPGKRVSVFEANWLETGSPGTSDVASMLSARDGSTAGREFLAYMAPPGRQSNVTDPFTGQRIGDATHLYFFARDSARVRVRDAYTRGLVIDRTYIIAPGRYANCALNLAQWRSIYNGDGKASSGPERPYLLVEADRPISVFNTNFNDNWMTYFGTSQPQDFGVTNEAEATIAEAGDTLKVRGHILLAGRDSIKQTQVEVIVGNGATVIESHLRETGGSLDLPGKLTINPNTGETRVTFEQIPDLSPQSDYGTETRLHLNSNYGNGDPIMTHTVIQVETVVSGEIGGTYQQASTATGITNQTTNRPPPMFFRLSNGNTITTDQRENLGVAFGDYNNDGFQDVFVPGYNSGQAGLLYRNNGDRTFTRITEGPLATDPGVGVAATWGDFDNDGDLDLFVAFAGSPSKLYVNQGDGTFAPVTSGDIARYNSACFNAAWVDYDRDGYLDLFLSDYTADKPNALFRNQGDGTFVQLNSSLHLPAASYSLGATWCDYDGDGAPDLFVPNDNGEANFLYRNNGDGTFTAITEGAIVTDGGSSTGAAWADYDQDGDFDLLVTNRGREVNFLYRNEGDGTFTRILEGAIANDIGDSQGAVWGDIDHDGDLDLFITNSGDGRHFLYLNQGDGTFAREMHEPVTRLENYALGTAMADIENDGDLDLFVSTHFDQPNYLFANNGNSHSWFQVKLVGARSNRSAIGAKVRVKTTVDGQPHWQVRQISGQSGGGPGAQSSLVAHFGLGQAALIDTLLVEWPSGYRQFETQVPANQLYVVQEESGTLISGQVYYDRDSSCSLSAGEHGIPGLMVRIDPGGRHVVTDSLGQYRVHLHEGTYTVAQVPHPSWAPLCPTGPETHTVVVAPDGGVPSLRYQKATPLADCSWGCSTTLTGQIPQNLTIQPGEQVCIAAGANFAGSITFRGGTLVLCGTAQIQNLNFNNGNEPVLIVVAPTGSFQVSSLNVNSDRITFVNYGENTALGTLNLNGLVENHGRLLLSGLNINNGSLLNTGQLLLSGGLNNNATLTNYGTIEVAGTVANNGSANWDNQCRLIIAGDFNQNGTFHHAGYMAVNGESRFQGAGNSTFAAGAKLETTHLTVNSDLQGPPRPQVSLRVSQRTTLNAGAVIYGYIDICDADGIETMYASLATFSSIDCAGSFDEEHCHDGTGTRAYTGYDFGNRGLCPAPDLAVSLGTTALRRGFVNTFALQVENQGPEDATGVIVEMALSSWLDIKGVQPPAQDTVYFPAYTLLRWAWPRLPALSRQTLTVMDSVRAEVPFGDLLTTTLWAGSQEVDCDTTNNAAVSVDEVVGSFDPNDKLVFPRGYGEDGYIRMTDTLYYKVRFQNVGNYYASRVVIRDTLSANLDLATFVAGPMSHEGRVDLVEGNILVWSFDNIYLPDSGTNEPMSHGFVQYKILPRPDLPNGATILNQAAIVFDYNEPIYTNTTYHTVTDRLSLEDDYRLIFTVYPNPVTTTSRAMVGMLDGTLLPVPLERVSIVDALGREVDLRQPAGSSEILIHHDQYRPGIYYLIATDIYGFRYTGNMRLFP